MAIVPVTVIVQNQADSLPLDGVLVQAYTSGDVFDSEATTGTLVSGQADLNLNGEIAGVAYTLRLSLAGRRFPSGAAVSVTVTDPPAPNNVFGPFASVIGPSAPLVIFNTVESDTVTAIQNVLVRVYDASNTFVAEGTTNSQGVLEVPLAGTTTPGTTYFVRPILAETVFTPTLSIAVLDPITPPSLNSFNLIGTPRTLPSALNPSYCRITGYLVDAKGVGVADVSIRITPIKTYSSVPFSHHFTSIPAIVDSKVITHGVSIESDSTGYVDFELPQQGEFNLHIGGAQNPIKAEKVVVPSLASASFQDFIFPFVSSVVYTPSAISINFSSGTTEATTTITATDQLGRTIENEILHQLLEFSSSLETVATVQVDSSSGNLVITAVSVGTSTISVSRKVGTSAVRIPNETSLSSTLIVTIT